MVTVRVLRPPINSDSAAEVPRAQWKELLGARREFCEQELPHDCRLLLFFIQDGAANEWLGLGGREQYIREGLNLEPQMVEWALQGLKATRPDVAVKFADMVALGKHGGDHKSEEFRLIQNQVGNAHLKPLPACGSKARIRARLERDAADAEHPEKQEVAGRLLPRVQSGELSPHAAAVEAGWRTRMIQHPPTVDGFARAIARHLNPSEQSELREQLGGGGTT